MAKKQAKRQGKESLKAKTIKKVVKKLKDEVSAGELGAVVGGLELYYQEDEAFLKRCSEKRVGRLISDELPYGDGVPVMDGPCGSARRRRR